MGRTDTEVEMGLSSHPRNDFTIRKLAPPNPVMTTLSQNRRARPREAGRWDRPWMVEEERKVGQSANMVESAFSQLLN